MENKIKIVRETKSEERLEFKDETTKHEFYIELDIEDCTADLSINLGVDPDDLEFSTIKELDQSFSVLMQLYQENIELINFVKTVMLKLGIIPFQQDIANYASEGDVMLRFCFKDESYDKIEKMLYSEIKTL